jgi:hypothetical protein
MDNTSKIPDDGMQPTIVEHLIIRDKTTEQVLLRQKGDLVHRKDFRKDTH